MTRLLCIVLVGVLFGCVWAVPAAAILGSVRIISKLTDRSAVIVRAGVVYVNDGSDGMLITERSPDGYALTGRLVEDSAGAAPGIVACPVFVRRAGINVASVLKGAPMHAGTIIEIEFYVPRGPRITFVPWPDLRVGDHGLFFLDATRQICDLRYPFLPIATGAPPVEPDLPPIEAIKRYLLSSLRPGIDEPIIRSAVEGLIELNVPEAVEQLAALSVVSDPRIAGDGLMGLVAFQDRRAFPAAVEFLLQAPPGAERQIGELSVAIARLRDPNLASAVTPLLDSPNAHYRRAALDALRQMKNLDTIPRLVAVATSDDDSLNNYIAMAAVSEMLGHYGDWLVELSTFSPDPSYYLTLFGDWWAREGAALYETRRAAR